MYKRKLWKCSTYFRDDRGCAGAISGAGRRWGYSISVPCGGCARGHFGFGGALSEKCATRYEFFHQGQMEQARELQKVLLRASNQIVSKFGIAGVKFVMDQRGYRGGNPRLPLQPLTHEHKARISSVLATIEQPILASA